MFRRARAPSLRSVALIALIALEAGVVHAQQAAPAPTVSPAAADHYRNGARAATVPHGAGSYSNGARNSTVPSGSAPYANGARASTVTPGSPHHTNGARASTVAPGSNANGARAATVPTDSAHYANGARVATVPTDSPHYANGARAQTVPFNAALNRPPLVASGSAPSGSAPTAASGSAPSASPELASSAPEVSAPVPSSNQPLVPEAASPPSISAETQGAALDPGPPPPASSRVTFPAPKSATTDQGTSEVSTPTRADEYDTVADSPGFHRERGPFARFLDVFVNFALVAAGILVASAAAWAVGLSLTKRARANQRDERSSRAPQTDDGQVPPRSSRRPPEGTAAVRKPAPGRGRA
jgi:hypothetical protein